VSLLKRFRIHSTAKEIRIKSRTPRWLVPIIVFRIRSLPGYLELDLSVWRQIRCPLRNNLLQAQRSPQALLLVTQPVRCASRKRRNNGQKVKYHCSNDTPFSLSIDLFSFDDSIINNRYSSAFIPRATPHVISSLSIAKPMPRATLHHGS
jgi:hypothetical protein